MLADKAELTKILTYHVAGARYTPDQLASGRRSRPWKAPPSCRARWAAPTRVNNAHVVCGNVQTANATVYIIDTVLMPPSPRP